MSAITKVEYEKLPKISSINNCIVPLLENRVDEKASKDDKLRKFDNCLPEDLLLSLKQAEQPKEYLGPPSKKTLNGIKPTIPSIVKKPDNAWNYEKQREKFKFLTEQPICTCGAGKDLSFLYDCVIHEKAPLKQKPSKYDLSAVRSSETITQPAVQLPETLIPDEFKLVTNKGVVPIKVDENQYTAVTDDHANHLTTFPSLKPTTRYEVIQLKHTMDALLSRVGADIIDQKGPTQLHNLLEIIKQEQDIYNIIFHEVIRQVTVECKERGEILAKLRERYANLLSRVPREIKSLHEEIIAQRTLDRRLTEELVQFKNIVALLTDELAKVKEHDRIIGEQADLYKNDLQKALLDSEKNASLLTEYHELYELQRKRLEKTIELLIEERDIWIKTSYSIGTKVIEENKLNTCKRLNMVEKSWFKLCKHFSILLSDRNTKDLIEVQKMCETWKTIVNESRDETAEKENSAKKSINMLRVDLTKLKTLLIDNTFDGNGQLINLPNNEKISRLLIQLKKVLEGTSKLLEEFNGDAVLLCEDKLKKGERVVFSLIQLCNKIISRHDLPKDQKVHDDCLKYDTFLQKVKQLHEQYRVRTCGDNGMSKSLTNFVNGLDVWIQKLSTHMLNEFAKTKIKVGEAEWQALYQSFDDWFEFLNKAYNVLGNPLLETNDSKPDDSFESFVPNIINHDDLVNEFNSWMAMFNHFIDSQDAFVVEEVHVNHTKMVHWMVQVLIHLASDREELSEEAKKIIYETTTSIHDLEKIGSHLGDKLEKFTNVLAERSNSIVTEYENNRKANEESTYEKELASLRNVKADIQEWKYLVKLLIAELHGDKTHRKSVADRLSFHSGMSNSDREKEDFKEEDEELLRKSQIILGSEIRTPDNQDQPLVADSTNNIQNEAPIKEEEKEEENTQQNEVENEPQNAQLETKKEEPEAFQETNYQQSIEPTTFEIINKDTNTERKFLENINFDESNSLSENELKSTVFNAFKTIEKLQDDLFKTEERAQKSEERVAELELQLKYALTQLRELTNQNQ